MGLHNTVREMFPLFIRKRSAAAAGALRPKWFHDLYRPNHRPYDPKEIEIIRRFTALADEDFEREAHKS